MIPQINIVAMVDVLAALSSGSLTGNLYLVDNRRGPNTAGEGTATLVSDVTNTQVLNWHVMPIDFQTEVVINKITFYRNGAPTAADTPCAKLREYGAPSGDYWAGVVNAPGTIENGVYQYLIEFRLGTKAMVMEQFASINVTTLS